MILLFCNCHLSSAEQFNPFAPSSLQGLLHYYELIRPCLFASVLSPSRFFRLWFLSYHRRTGSYVPFKSLYQIHATSMPDAARTVDQVLFELFLALFRNTSFDIVVPISTPLQWIIFIHLFDTHLTQSICAFSLSLTTMAFDLCSIR